MYRSFAAALAAAVVLITGWNAPAQDRIDPETTPSRSYYFDWVNRNWHGSNTDRVLANLDFFRFMHDEFGMRLDYYLLDTATLDNGPRCLEMPGRPAYVTLDDPHYLAEYPGGLRVIVDAAAEFGCKVGVWLGPDGYGSTEEQAEARIRMLESLVRDEGVRVFKLDSCASDLAPENERHFIEAMQRCRAIAPDLIVLNHRATLSEEGRPHATAHLWEGMETYIDVFQFNPEPAPHHRAGALTRPLPPGLRRDLEDHGVCLSSCMDYWEDDLILQAFNRALIMAPEIYGNPWLLSDDELPRLARLFNLHREHRDLLVDGLVLDVSRYGVHAVSRGDDATRLITMRQPLVGTDHPAGTTRSLHRHRSHR
jgi:hypothetical protein